MYSKTYINQPQKLNIKRRLQCLVHFNLRLRKGRLWNNHLQRMMRCLKILMCSGQGICLSINFLKSNMNHIRKFCSKNSTLILRIEVKAGKEVIVMKITIGVIRNLQLCLCLILIESNQKLARKILLYHSWDCHLSS